MHQPTYSYKGDKTIKHNNTGLGSLCDTIVGGRQNFPGLLSVFNHRWSQKYQWPKNQLHNKGRRTGY